MVHRLENALNRKTTVLETKDVQINATDDNAVRDMDDEEVDGDLFQQEQDEIFDASSVAQMPASDLTAHILPLYSLMAPDDQAKVFEKVPENHRLIVVATNIAETSLTIPHVSYIVDSGRQKTKNFHNGVASFDIAWISKAAARQRAGRAGRTGPGHCYRVYSSSVYDRQFEEFDMPEILNRPLEDVVLTLKVLQIKKIEDFPLPTPRFIA